MEMFELGGLKDQGETVDRKSRNKVPVGSLKKEVRDDVPINISEGEFVLPADVVRYHGLEKIMNMRQDAKAGLNMMNRMGQMGNSDQATLPDDIPFQPKNFQQGGVTIQNPQIQQPQIIPDVQQQNQVPGVTFTQPTAPMVRPSIYSQKPMMPNVNVPPKVDIPKQTTYKPPQYKTPTGTAATPDFSKLIGTRFGQLQKTETKKYVNSETGEELFIPFVDGQPVYPIPDGFVFEKDVEKEEAKEKATEAIKTTQVMQQDSGSSDDSTLGDTFVSRPPYNTSLPIDYEESVGKPPTPEMIKKLEEEERKLGVGTTSVMSKAFTDVKNYIARGINPINAIETGIKFVKGAVGALTGSTELKEITPEVQNKRAQDLGIGYDELVKNLGLENKKTNLSIGHQVGGISPLHPESVYNSKGLLIDLDKSKNLFNYGGSKRFNNVGIRATTEGFKDDLLDMYRSGWYGGYTGLGASATLSDVKDSKGLSARDRENDYRKRTGMPPLPPKTEALKALAGFNTGYDLSDNRDKSKDIYVRDNGGGVVTGGKWVKNKNNQLQYDRGPGRGIIIAGKGGRLGVFPTRDIGRTSIIKDPKVIGKEVDIKGDIKDPRSITPFFKVEDFQPSDASAPPPRPSSVDLTPTGADYSGSQELADTYAEEGGGAGSDSGFGETGTASETGAFSSTGDFGFTAEGGFISRRRATKIKKKRGGLASR